MVSSLRLVVCGRRLVGSQWFCSALFIGRGLKLHEGLGVPADELDDSSGCIKQFIKPDVSPRQAASCCNGSDNDSLSFAIFTEKL